MKRILLSFLLLNSLLSAEGDDKLKHLNLLRTNDPIIIDGLIDDVWNTADSVSDFEQFQPFHGVSPLRKTIAKVLTQKMLYTA